MSTPATNERFSPGARHIAAAMLTWLGVELAGVGGFDLLMLNSGIGWPMIYLGIAVSIAGLIWMFLQRRNGPIGAVRTMLLAAALSPITLFPVFLGWQISVSRAMIAHCHEGDPISCRTVAAKKAKRGKTAEAIALYQQGCDMNNARSCRELAGQANNFPDLVKTSPLTLYKHACDLGDAIGCDRAAQTLKNDDHAQALTYFTRACDLAYQSACNVLEEIKSHP